MLPMFIIYSAICDVLETDGHVMEAISSFQHMQREVAPGTCIDSEDAQWELSELYRMDTARDRLNIEHRFSAANKRLEELAEVALGSQDYIKAAEHFSTMLSLDTEDHVDILIKRSRARVMMESWEDALRDADEVYPVSSHHEDCS